jgi:hypothetical protein
MARLFAKQLDLSRGGLLLLIASVIGGGCFALFAVFDLALDSQRLQMEYIYIINKLPFIGGLIS